MAALLLRIVIITALIRLALIANEVLSSLVMTGVLTFERDFANQFRDTAVSFSIVVIVVIFAQFSSLLGFHRFINLLAGRYYRPVREERAFLFLDLKDSSELTIKLGDVRFHEFLAQFFYEADRAIVKTGGEIVAYVGDAVIVTWPLLEDRTQNARPLVALGEILQRLEEVSPDFIEKYGRAPAIRAALHGGPVVVGECGDSRRQITFLGEVVNMTARIETEAKALGKDYLASVTVLHTLELLPNIKTKSVGKVMLKGARAPLELFQIEFS
jgi:adenylate cyclase